jgi:hypothetical protein
MTRTSRFHLVLCLIAIFALASAPLAGAGPRETSRAVHRSDDGWLEAALGWVEGLIGLRGPTSDRATASTPVQKDGGNSTTGGNCIDPAGKPWCAL